MDFQKNGAKSHPFKKFLSYDDESESKATLLGDTRREHSFSSEIGKKNLIGCYKGTNVSIKRVVKKSVEIDRDLKKQLQLRKELNHDNVARFIGACVETPYVYILSQYCSRGSLQVIICTFQKKVLQSVPKNGAGTALLQNWYLK